MNTSGHRGRCWRALAGLSCVVLLGWGVPSGAQSPPDTAVQPTVEDVGGNPTPQELADAAAKANAAAEAANAAAAAAQAAAKAANDALARAQADAAAKAQADAEKAAAASAEQPKTEFGLPTEPLSPTWSELDGSAGGWLLGKSDKGMLSLSGYALVRYINQTGNDTYTDHLGNERPVDRRNDIQFHRAMLHFKGWLWDPKFRYQITAWSVMSTNQTTLYGFLGYQFHKTFNLYGGTGGNGGSRSLYGSHPFWLANDRVMGDEFFRGAFSNGIWANGEIAPGLWYQAALTNNLTQLGYTATDLTRDMTKGIGMWWMPTTQEFGPNGSYGDWDYHEKVATRFGWSAISSRENRYNDVSEPKAKNNWTKLQDSVPVFDTGALAPGVTVKSMDYETVSLDAAVKYRGMFLMGECYRRWLSDFDATGPLPVSSIIDDGFMVQASFYPVKQKVETYAATSWIYGDKDAGFGTSYEYVLGGNYYLTDSRNLRINGQVLWVHGTAPSSTFGFYVGGQTGVTYSLATSIYF